jgi:hypothetical protein
VLEDCLSRLPRAEPAILEGKNVVTPAAAYVEELGAFVCSLYDDLEMMECFLTLPIMTPEQASPLDFAWMQQQQQQDETLQQRLAAHPNEYVQRQFTDTISLIVFALLSQCSYPWLSGTINIWATLARLACETLSSIDSMTPVNYTSPGNEDMSTLHLVKSIKFVWI